MDGTWRMGHARQLRNEISGMCRDGDRVWRALTTDWQSVNAANLTITLNRAASGDRFEVRMVDPITGEQLFDYHADVLTPRAASVVALAFLAAFEGGL